MIFNVDEERWLPRAVWAWLVKEHAAWKCEQCGRGEDEVESIHAHHVNGNDCDNRLANGQCLCSHCHLSLTHRGRKQSPAHVAARSAALRSRTEKRVLSPQHRARIGAAFRGRKQNPDHVKKRIDSRIATLERRKEQ